MDLRMCLNQEWNGKGKNEKFNKQLGNILTTYELNNQIYAGIIAADKLGIPLMNLKKKCRNKNWIW